jgi:hypothetical protein
LANAADYVSQNPSAFSGMARDNRTTAGGRLREANREETTRPTASEA